MTYKNFSILTKVVTTLILTYSVFMILFVSIFDLLSMSTSVSFTTFFIENMIPNISAVIALIFLIRYLWITDKNSNLSAKNPIERNNHQRLLHAGAQNPRPLVGRKTYYRFNIETPNVNELPARGRRDLGEFTPSRSGLTPLRRGAQDPSDLCEGQCP